MIQSGGQQPVRTQDELDAALAAGVIPVCIGRGFFRVGGSATVLARDYVEVEARDASRIDANDHAVVRAAGRAEVEATGDAEVYVEDGAVVRARGRSIVHATEGASVFVSEQATVKVEGPLAAYEDSRGERALTCPLCGSPVSNWVCTNKMDCGYILCSICADGSGGSNTKGVDPCPHFAVTLWDEDEVMDGIEVSVEPPLSLGLVLDDLTRAAGGVARSSVFLDSRVSGMWTDYFVPDLTAFEQNLIERLRKLAPLAGVDVLVFAVEPALLLSILDGDSSDPRWPALVSAGIGHVVDLEAPSPSVPDKVTLSNVAGGEDEEARVHETAEVVISRMRAGEGVVLRGARSALMERTAAEALLGLGLDPQDVLERVSADYP
jgi:hypothetical protein